MILQLVSVAPPTSGLSQSRVCSLKERDSVFWKVFNHGSECIGYSSTISVPRHWISMGMGHHLQLVLLVCMLAGASAIPSREEPQGNIFKELDEGDVSLAGGMVRFANGTELQLFPATSEAHVQEHVNGTRRMLGVFRQCSPCTCCDKTRRWCLPTVCCYNIRCGLQGLPYGLCSFIPISCTCFGCRQ